MKKIAIFLGLMLAAASAGAVDGYKNVKFGASIDEVKQANLCGMLTYKNDLPGMDSLVCEDFKFSGDKTFASAIFLNGKFERLAIKINTKADVVINALKEKYGEPSSSSTQEEMSEALKNGGNIYIRFDNDTIFVQGNHDVNTNKDVGFLIYTSSTYVKTLHSLQSKSIKEDL